ncbi:MAG: nuclease-related domain-containing protein [Coraliomargaritaceae bacterium]
MLFLIIVSIICLVGAKLVFSESPKSKGAKGEAIVAFALSNSLEPEVYKQINDIIIPRNNYHNQASRTDSAQIDHIVLSEYGIFVIETKNYSGWIFGSPQSRIWTQVVYSEKNKFQNPIKQNWGHIYALSYFLQVPRYKFRNIVCFVGDAEFKTELPQEVYIDGSFVDFISSHKEKVLSPSEVSRIAVKLSMEV